jgi:hypothetical protein
MLPLGRPSLIFIFIHNQRFIEEKMYTSSITKQEKRKNQIQKNLKTKTNQTSL